jgi:hypothetical protein
MGAEAQAHGNIVTYPRPTGTKGRAAPRSMRRANTPWRA